MRRSVFRLLVVFFAALQVAPACAAGVAAYCAELQWVLLAPDGGGTVQVIDVRRGVTPLATLRSRQRGPIVALHVQAASRRVWVLADNGLDAHDGFSGRLLGHWPAPAGVRLDRLEADGAGRPTAWSGAQAFEAVSGAAALVPAGARLGWR